MIDLTLTLTLIYKELNDGKETLANSKHNGNENHKIIVDTDDVDGDNEKG
jgi:hypothetical protein